MYSIHNNQYIDYTTDSMKKENVTTIYQYCMYESVREMRLARVCVQPVWQNAMRYALSKEVLRDIVLTYLSRYP